MGRSRNGKAVPVERLTDASLAELAQLQLAAREGGDLAVWLRTRAVRAYIDGARVVEIARQLDVGASSVRDWIRWFAKEGAAGLRSAKRGKSLPKLDGGQRGELAAVLDRGPLAAGWSSAMWTGKLVAAVILAKFGVSFHPQSVPRLLHEMGYSVQRPRKRLARADPEAQRAWKEERMPALKKRPKTATA